MSETFKYRLTYLNEVQVPTAIELDLKTLGGQWSAQGYRQEIERANSICLGLHPWNAPEQLMGMGFAWCVQDEAHIILIAVDPKFQAQGFGRLILQNLLLLAASQGCERSTLEVSIHNIAAIRLYQKLGFQELGQRPHYYGKGDHALILWLNRLSNHQVESLNPHPLGVELSTLDSSKM